MPGSAEKNPSNRDRVELHCDGLLKLWAYRQKYNSILLIIYVKEQYISPTGFERQLTAFN